MHYYCCVERPAQLLLPLLYYMTVVQSTWLLALVCCQCSNGTPNDEARLGGRTTRLQAVPEAGAYGGQLNLLSVRIVFPWCFSVGRRRFADLVAAVEK